MSSSAVDDLLNSPEYHSDDIGDIGAEEEEALLEEEYEQQEQHNPELQDGEILDLDSGNIIEEEGDETFEREDRFHSERPIKQVRGGNKMVSVETHRNLAGPQARKRFLNKSSPQTRTNLQQVKVADYIPLNTKQPEITIKIEKGIEEEDETVKKYRLLIEEQKKLREEILRRKEERRKNAAAGGSGDIVSEPLVTSKVLTNSLKWSKTIENNNIVNEQKNVTVNDVNVESNSCTAVDKNAVTSFLSNRKIIAKDDTLPDTSIVVVSNLATGSTEVKLRKLCKGVGDVKNLVISPIERQATIEFKSVASAHTFYKKYQRFMLDLSMIQVVLKKT
ncbi:protein SDA1 homolog isoform X4 [Onthophagus taurus]|uniref:protein SDA1 homolog isoform X4 n=1 Tax=Onthophagus taurus TaxID=166361 RepID=UPI0039BE37B2